MKATPRLPFSLLRLFLGLPLALWMLLVMALRLPGPGWLSVGIGVLAGLGSLAVLLFLRHRAGLALFAATFLTVLGAFLSMRPSNDREWMPDVARLASGSMEGNRLRMRNVRNCRYRPDTGLEVRFEDRTFDLTHLRSMDLFLISWGPRHIAHTILSFDFGNQGHLAFSIETRKERHERYSALRGFFREYELCIIAGDERDLIRLRANARHEQVRLYRLNTPPHLAREILTDFVWRINELNRSPEWYNALAENCTTAMVGPVRSHSTRLPWSWKLVVSGHLDELLYDRGFLNRDLPFAQLREKALINDRALAADQDPAFSARIREGLPPR